MARPAVSANAPSGVTWPKAIVDAPDAYYEAVRVNLTGRTVTVTSPKGDEVGRYELDADTAPANGSLAGVVDGKPFTVAKGCNCGTPYSKTMKAGS